MRLVSNRGSPWRGRKNVLSPGLGRFRNSLTARAVGYLLSILRSFTGASPIQQKLACKPCQIDGSGSVSEADLGPPAGVTGDPTRTGLDASHIVSGPPAATSTGRGQTSQVDGLPSGREPKLLAHYARTRWRIFAIELVRPWRKREDVRQDSMIATEFARMYRLIRGLACLRPQAVNSTEVVSFRLAAISLWAFLLVLSSCSRGFERPPASRVEDPVESFVQKHMQPGSAAFFVPSPVKRDEPVEGVLEISPPTIKPEELQRQLELLAGRLGVGASGSVKIASRMVANLVADRDCTITPKDPLEQAVIAAQGTTWRWTVIPRVRGTTRLTVTLTAQVVMDSRETSYRVTSFERNVDVTVTNTGVVSDVLGWAKDYWIILCAIGSGLVWLVAWLRRRRKRRGSVGFKLH